MDENEEHLYWFEPSIKVEDRWKSYGHKSCVLWLTGLSASGKSTIANVLCKQLHLMGIRSYVLDGDNIRHGLNKDIGFSLEDRKENIRRIGEVAKLLIDAGLIVLTAFISPYSEDRKNVKELLKGGEFIEVFVKCSLSECERRDPKGIYKKARAGQIRDFTGISAPYQEPEDPDILLETDKIDIGECVKKVLDYLLENGYINIQEQS